MCRHKRIKFCVSFCAFMVLICAVTNSLILWNLHDFMCSSLAICTLRCSLVYKMPVDWYLHLLVNAASLHVHYLNLSQVEQCLVVHVVSCIVVGSYSQQNAQKCLSASDLFPILCSLRVVLFNLHAFLSNEKKK